MNIKLISLQDADEFIGVCEKFNSDIDMKYGRYIVDAKSKLGVFGMGVDKEVEVTINTADEEEERRFYEEMRKWEENV